MTREEREKHLDWLNRLKSEIFVFMPKDWIIPFANALDVAIKAIDEQGDVLREIRQEIAGFRDDAEIRYGHQLGFDKIYAYERCIDLIDTKIKELSE